MSPGADPPSPPFDDSARAPKGLDWYWQHEFAPALDRGARPPLGDSFHRFLAQTPIATSLAASVDGRVADEPEHPYSTHPPLRDRLAALSSAGVADAPDASARALDLLASIDSVELELLAGSYGREALTPTRAVPWEELIERVHLPMWREHIAQITDHLGCVTVGQLPSVAADPGRFATHLGASDPRELASEDARTGTRWTLGAALCVTLADAGFTLQGEPGGPVIASRGSARLAPLESVEALIEGRLDPGRWHARCLAAGARLDAARPTVGVRNARDGWDYRSALSLAPTQTPATPLRTEKTTPATESTPAPQRLGTNPPTVEPTRTAIMITPRMPIHRHADGPT